MTDPDRDPGLDPQAAAVLSDLQSGIAPPSPTLSVATGRQMLEDLFAVADPAPVGGVTDLEIRGPNGPIPLQIYVPEGDGPFGPWISRSVTPPTGAGSATAKRSSSIARPVATDPEGRTVEVQTFEHDE